MISPFRVVEAKRLEQHPPRVIVDQLFPAVDRGEFPIKRELGSMVEVTAHVFVDGHDEIAVRLKHRHSAQSVWTESPLQGVGNDEWTGQFLVDKLGEYEYTVEAWINRFESWRVDLTKRINANQELANELPQGAALLERAAEFLDDAYCAAVLGCARKLRDERLTVSARADLALDPSIATIMAANPDPAEVVSFDKIFSVTVDPVHARFAAWYEVFPRSCSEVAGQHGTLRDLEKRLSDIADLGFDIVYLPPIHPIGTSYRKGPNNSLAASEADPGSPWAIGSPEGGHKAVHPQLGTIDDFDRLVSVARRLNLEIALDIAFQCSPDHPYVTEHPDWFKHRPDGSIRYAENPPKKYQDIYPLDFETLDWRTLWRELRNVVTFWIDHGVRVFRVDNPHTKPLSFWQWLIRELKREHPEAIFLAEAFTRPKIMRRLAKHGFSQSYTYFTWRNSRRELEEYLTELTQSEIGEYMRPNFFANTPDILHEYLQHGARPAHQIRLVLAATLAASYGIYSPPFELCECAAVAGTEEYLNSEKYQIRHWDFNQVGNIRQFIKVVNQIRKENPALHENRSLRFHPSDNDQIIAYSKHNKDRSNVILVVVNLDPHQTQCGWIQFPAHEFGISDNEAYQVCDLVGGSYFSWKEKSNFVELNPQVCPAHILKLRTKVRSESNFDYFA